MGNLHPQKRAAAILARHPDATDISFHGHYLTVFDEVLDIHADKLTVMCLMADEEFGFAVTNIEQSAQQLRMLQRKIRVSRDEAIAELESAKEIIDRYMDSGFLLGYHHEFMDGFTYTHWDREFAT